MKQVTKEIEELAKQYVNKLFNNALSERDADDIRHKIEEHYIAGYLEGQKSVTYFPPGDCTPYDPMDDVGVYIDDYNKTRKLDAIKQIMKFTGLTPREAEKMLESNSSTIPLREGITKKEAENIQKEAESSGLYLLIKNIRSSENSLSLY